MSFKKLALATAIASAPLSAFAMEDLTDDALSGVTGQDGIEMVLGIGTSGIQLDMYVHDKDGIATTVLTGTIAYGTGYSFDGAIVIDDMKVAVGGATISINIDAGSSAVSGAGNTVLNIAVGLPATLTISTGAIRVANSQRDDGTPAWSVDAMSSTILNNMTITLGTTNLNIQLGNEQQLGATTATTDMIVITTSMTGGLTMAGFRLNDATGSGDGGIGASAIYIDDNGAGTNLTAYLDINATDAGLVVTLAQLGSATGMDINIADQYLGSTSAGYIGDVSIVGLNVNGSTLTISGK